MNKLNTFFATVLPGLGAVTAVSAQAVITADDLYTIGSRYQVAIDESPGVTPGNSGINLSWNFAGLGSDATRIMEVLDPDESPFGPVLPGTRALVTNTNEAAEHFTVSQGQLLDHGRVYQEDGVQVEQELSPPMVLLQLPGAYYHYHQGVSRSENTFHVGLDIGFGYVVDSLRIRTRIAYESEVNGWGNVTTPFGTFDAIKHQVFSTIKDTIDVYRADQQQWIEAIETDAYSTMTWSWWTPGHGIPVLRLFDDEHDGTVDRAEWIGSDLSTTSIGDHASADRIDVYPNPAMDRITVPLEGLGVASYALHDAQGRLVQEGRISRERSTIPVVHLERGAYLLSIEQGGTVSQARVVLH